jgi:lysine/ornithine N-monooxygenase
VRSFTTDSAVFEDGDEEEFDVVILATGYTIAFPFMRPQSLLSVTVG